MQVYKTNQFTRFADKEKINDDSLYKAIRQAEKGNIDKKIRDDIIVQRVAREGQGKRRGYRTVILFKQGDKAFFLKGYERKKQDGINEKDVQYYKNLADDISQLNKIELQTAIKKGTIKKVVYNE